MCIHTYIFSNKQFVDLITFPKVSFKVSQSFICNQDTAVEVKWFPKYGEVRTMAL